MSSSDRTLFDVLDRRVAAIIGGEGVGFAESAVLDKSNLLGIASMLLLERTVEPPRITAVQWVLDPNNRNSDVTVRVSSLTMKGDTVHARSGYATDTPDFVGKLPVDKFNSAITTVQTQTVESAQEVMGEIFQLLDVAVPYAD